MVEASLFVWSQWWFLHPFYLEFHHGAFRESSLWPLLRLSIFKQSEYGALD